MLTLVENMDTLAIQGYGAGGANYYYDCEGHSGVAYIFTGSGVVAGNDSPYGCWNIFWKCMTYEFDIDLWLWAITIRSKLILLLLINYEGYTGSDVVTGNDSPYAC